MDGSIKPRNVHPSNIFKLISRKYEKRVLKCGRNRFYFIGKISDIVNYEYNRMASILDFYL